MGPTWVPQQPFRCLNYGDFEQNVFIQTLKKTNHQKNWGNIASLRKVYISMVGLNFRSYLVSQSGWLPAAYCDGSLCQYIGYPLPASKPTNQHPDTSHLTGCVMMMVSRYRLSHNFSWKFCEPPQRIVTRGQLSRSEIKLVLLGSLYGVFLEDGKRLLNVMCNFFRGASLIDKHDHILLHAFVM